MKRAIQRIVLSLIAIAGIGLIALVIIKNNQYRKLLVDNANEIFPTTVSCERFMYNPITKFLVLNNLRMGNPKGYESYNVVNFSRVEIEFDSMDVASNSYAIRNLTIKGADLNYELQGTRRSNLGDLLGLLDLMNAENGHIQLRIDHFIVEDMNISLSSLMMKKEIASLNAEGFTLSPFDPQETLTNEVALAKHALRALLMKTCSRLAEEKTKRSIMQFSEGAGDILEELKAEDANLAKQLGL